MEMSTQSDGKVAIISIAGRIDGTTTPQLETAAAALVDGGCQHVILDLRQVDYVSSAGLRTMLMVAKRTRTVGGGIALFGLQPSVEEVLTTSGFSGIVPVADDEAAARARLGA